MSGMGSADPSRLAELRAKIDAIDESVHRLLMQRASVIDELIEVKGTARNGAAFRPGREADMMRRLARRHQGHLPLTAIEHLWREIISTFTALQAPFDVLVAAGRDPVAAVETARFYCGFSVSLELVPDASTVVRALEAGGDRLGVVLLEAGGEPWWSQLRSVQIVGKLPFFEEAGRQAGAPALLLAPPLADPVPFEVECFTVVGAAEATPATEGVTVLAASSGNGHRSLLAATPGGAGAVEAAFGRGLDIRPVGGYAAPLRTGGPAGN